MSVRLFTPARLCIDKADFRSCQNTLGDEPAHLRHKHAWVYPSDLKRHESQRFIDHPSLTPGCAATLILSCLCRCFACSSSLSTAYCNLSFFALICFNLRISLSFPPSPPSPPALALGSDDDRLLRPSSPLDSRPSSSSHRAMSACSRRSSRSRWASQRERREFISGVKESRRER